MEKTDHVRRLKQVSWNAKFAAWSVRILLKPVLRPPIPLIWQRQVLSGVMALFPKPPGIRRDTVVLEGTIAEKLVPASHSEAEERRLILYWHGGGYAMGSPATHRSLAMHIAAQTNLPVIVPRYRLAPEHPYPAQIEDAIRCLKCLRQQGHNAGQLIFAGDSAGGNLALALALYCRNQGLSSPRGLILISPWINVLGRYDEDYHGDALLSAAWIRQLQDAYIPKPLRSPDFFPTEETEVSGLGPTLIQYASAEMLAPEARALGERMRNVGVKVTLDEAQGLWHVYQMHAGLVPEATQAIERIAEFVKGLG